MDMACRDVKVLLATFNIKYLNFNVLLDRVAVYFLIGAISVSFGDCFGWKKATCGSQNNKLLSILNILCNSTQTTSIQTRDACYGCFFRAGSLPGGQQQLTALRECANLYLINTNYAECAAVLQNSAPSVNAFACYTGYCNFVQCVRRINANRLIDGCIQENIVNQDFNNVQGRVNFYTNTTSCILARARCSDHNPITGELQNQFPVAATARYANAAGIGLVGSLINNARATTQFSNSLQITSTGDIRIIAFPTSINVVDGFCSRSLGLDQAGYGTTVC